MIARLERRFPVLRHLRHDGARHAGLCAGSGQPVATREPTALAGCGVCRQPAEVTHDPSGWGGAVLADHPAAEVQRHPMTRRERRWFRTQASHAGAFGNPEAARIATLRVFDLDPKADAGLGRTGVRP